MMRDLLRESRAAGESDRRSLSRVKQWLNYAHKRGAVEWFDLIKRARDTAELERELARLDRSANISPAAIAA
jgi:cell division protein FtsB